MSGPEAELRSRRFPRYAEVAVPLPLFQSFTYGVPASLAALAPGCRVRVRFGPRVLVGCVVSVANEAPSLPPAARIQPVLEALDREPVLAEELLQLGSWIADYYLAPPGDVFRAMLPPESRRAEAVLFERTVLAGAARLKEGSLRARVLAALTRPMSARALAKTVRAGRISAVSAALRDLAERGCVREIPKSRASGPLEVWAARLTEEGRRALGTETLRPNAARVLSILATATDPVPLGTIRNELGLKTGPFRSLARRGLLHLVKQSVPRSPWPRLRAAAPAPITFSARQAEVLEELRRAVRSGAYHPFVLHGVTGSGKTEVYLGAAEEALAAGRSVLFLVPEIALTPRLAGLLGARFGERVAILHSALGTGERRDEWWRIQRGEARVVVGARAAVLAPLTGIGLVVVDEEHETSFKQEESPRYNARDVAIKRARDDSAVVVLGSATPSLESYSRAMAGRYRLVSLPERIGGRPLARVELIDMKEVVREEGPDVVISRPLREAVSARLEGGEQALILLNRRGYAGQLHCRQCGLSAQCSQCSVALTLHQKATLAVCHYCGLGRPTPKRCDLCQGEYLRLQGYGTERLEEIVRALYPGARVARMDRDTMRRKGSHERLLARFAARELDLLVGTQMLAKGHDFPSVTLVGVLAADAGLGAPDFRAAERTFQLLTQVAGRAGRGERPGDVLIQTFTPDHYSLRLAAGQDYAGFYEEEARFRRALAYPPVLSLINLMFEADAMSEAARAARQVAEVLRSKKPDGVEILGPAFAARSRVAGRYRCQVLLKVPRSRHRAVRALLGSLFAEPGRGKSMSVDVDPMTLA